MREKGSQLERWPKARSASWASAAMGKESACDVAYARTLAAESAANATTRTPFARNSS